MIVIVAVAFAAIPGVMFGWALWRWAKDAMESGAYQIDTKRRP